MLSSLIDDNGRFPNSQKNVPACSTVKIHTLEYLFTLKSYHSLRTNETLDSRLMEKLLINAERFQRYLGLPNNIIIQFKKKMLKSPFAGV